MNADSSLVEWFKFNTSGALEVTTRQTILTIPFLGIVMSVFGEGNATTSAYILVKLDVDAAMAVGASM